MNKLDIDIRRIKSDGWIGIDFDKTLAVYHSGDYKKYGPCYTGDPIKPTVDLVKELLRQGIKVKVFTARVAERDPELLEDIKQAIYYWCEVHIGQLLEVTNIKDHKMFLLLDDKAIQLEPNTGRIIKDAS